MIIKKIFVIALLFSFLNSCKTEDLILKKLDVISADKYYDADIIPDSAKDIYGLWKFNSTSGGFSGMGFTKDFDFMLLKPNAIFGIVKNDSLIGYGKLILKNNIDGYLKNSVFCNFDFDQSAQVGLAFDNEKYISLTGNDTMNLIAPCCDRYNLELVRVNSELDNVMNHGLLKGKISIGPLCPVETIPPQPGCQPTSETYIAWQTSVWNESKTILIKDINPDLTGNFEVKLPVGKYNIDFKSSQSHSFGGSNFPLKFSISKAETTIVDINIDTGIR